jgi:hypothetical protein
MKKRLTEKQRIRRDLRIKKKKEIRQEKLRLKKQKRDNYQNFVNEVKLRDNYTCFICKKYLKDGNVHNIQVHHILAKETYKELICDINNGITLCYFDHKNSKFSPHLNAFAFIDLLRNKRPFQHDYLLIKLKKHLI